MKKLFIVAMVLFALPTMVQAADFNGDGTNDIGIFRESSGLWAIRGVTRVYFGSIGDEAMPGDYNGDGTVDIGLFRGSSGLWAVKDVTRAYFGGSTDEPLPGISGGAVSQELPKTGQTFSKQTGDDGTYQKGLDVLHDNGDETVTDIRTGLMWPKDGTGLGYASGGSKTQDEVIDWANALNFAGYTDWRLPNINELKSFQEVTWGHYQNQPRGYYWSSTASAYTLNFAFTLVVNFTEGNVCGNCSPNPGYVVAVRGGE